MLQASLPKNDKLAYQLIGVLSFVVFAAVVLLSRVTLEVNLGFNPHVFAFLNAVINSAVSILLILAFVFVKQKNYVAHKNVMLVAIVLSAGFLVSYIAHHLFAGETRFGGEGGIRTFYYIILASHIVLAAVILPFILLTAYRSLTGEYGKHKKIARYTFPLWLYVSVTGVLVYLLISPYYS
jgi:putative membrane protein